MKKILTIIFLISLTLICQKSYAKLPDDNVDDYDDYIESYNIAFKKFESVKDKIRYRWGKGYHCETQEVLNAANNYESALHELKKRYDQVNSTESAYSAGLLMGMIAAIVNRLYDSAKVHWKYSMTGIFLTSALLNLYKVKRNVPFFDFFSNLTKKDKLFSPIQSFLENNLLTYIGSGVGFLGITYMIDRII